MVIGNKLFEKDDLILEALSKWKFLLSRHIEYLCAFQSRRTMYRRLKVLEENKFIKKEKILYGVASIYTLAHKGLVALGLNKRIDKIRIDTIRHDIYVIDTLIYLLKNNTIDNLDSVISEKELNRKNGFSNRKHEPDFIFSKDGYSYSVEVELSTKPLERLEKNMQTNFINYDNQIWVTSKNKKVEKNLKMLIPKYKGVTILNIEEVKKWNN